MTDPTVDTASEQDGDTAPVPARSTSRRSMMVASAGAAAAAAAALATSGSVEAADTDPLLVGVEDNFATSRTRLLGPSFVVTDTGVEGSLSRRVGGTTTGVYGVTTESGAGTVSTRAVWGNDETPGGVGVFGQHGTTGEGVGVIAQSFNGPGLGARGTTFDLLLQQSGRMNFTSAGDIAPTTTAPVGTLARSGDGSLWYAKGDDDWVRLAGGERTSTFTPIEPTRVYDSRVPLPLPGAVAAGGRRRLSVRSGRDLTSGAVFDSNLVPAEATAVSYNVTVTRTIGSGFLTVAPGDAAVARASSINWTEVGQTIANAGIVKIDGDGAVTVFVGGPGGATDFIIDVTGYYA